MPQPGLFDSTRSRRVWPAVCMLGVAVILAALGTPAPARADGLWCASVQGPDGGYVSCGYSSWQQCQAALSGQGGICYRNPGANRPRPRRGG